jgi:lipopolysaccharide/colanic/teichoic acid biosynthesis glycosyltransferase
MDSSTFNALTLEPGPRSLSSISSDLDPDRTPFSSVPRDAAAGLPIQWCDGMPVMPTPTRSRRARLWVKLLQDIVLSVLALLFLAPLLFIVAILVRFSSPGPVLFRQTRIGFQSRPFTIYKFRTLYMEKCDSPGTFQVTSADERVTPIGRFLRRMSIDELPQLINVVVGDMSLVGPRPYVPEMLAGGQLYRDIEPYFSMRYWMKPGLTGWAQAHGLRGSTHNADLAKARLLHDIAYIQSFGLLLDVKIMFTTLSREIAGGSGS